MPDAHFAQPRLAELYDPLDPDRGDLAAYVASSRRMAQYFTSDSTLSFRKRAEVVESLHTAGFVASDVRDARDRPGREFVFIASAN